jgi:hypothetical protein
MKWKDGAIDWKKLYWPMPPSIDNQLAQYQTYMNYVQSQFMYMTTPSFSMKFETEWNDLIDAALKPQPIAIPAARSVVKEEPMIRTCPYICCNPTLPTNDLITVGKEK